VNCTRRAANLTQEQVPRSPVLGSVVLTLEDRLSLNPSCLGRALSPAPASSSPRLGPSGTSTATSGPPRPSSTPPYRTTFPVGQRTLTPATTRSTRSSGSGTTAPGSTYSTRSRRRESATSYQRVSLTTHPRRWRGSCSPGRGCPSR